MDYLFWYFIYAIPCFFIVYVSGTIRAGRLQRLCSHGRAIPWSWSFYQIIARSGAELFIHDYFGVYCPWSWERARRIRLTDRKIDLGSKGRYHWLLGHITAAHCDDPDMQEWVARLTFVSRPLFWTKGVWGYMLSPLPGTLIIVYLFVRGFRDLRQHLSAKNYSH